MKLPVTGNPDIDKLTVQAVIALYNARTEAVARAAGLRQRLQALQGARWARRQRALMGHRVRQASAFLRALATPTRPVSKGRG